MKANGQVLIDTSAWIHALRPTGLSAIRLKVQELLLEGRAATCEMIILELLGGTRTEKEYLELGEELRALQQFPITDAVWNQAFALAHALRRQGISIPSTDQLIASVALTYGCSLLHQDKHFGFLARHVKIAMLPFGG